MSLGRAVWRGPRRPRREDPCARRTVRGHPQSAGIRTGLTLLFSRHQPQLTPVVVASALTLGIFGTGVAYYLDYRLLIKEGPVIDSMTMYMFPVVSVTLGAVVLSEPLTWNLLAGTVIVVTGMYLVQHGVRDREAMKERTARAGKPIPLG